MKVPLDTVRKAEYNTLKRSAASILRLVKEMDGDALSDEQLENWLDKEVEREKWKQETKNDCGDS